MRLLVLIVMGVCYGQTAVAEPPLFSFHPFLNSAAYSTRSLSKGEILGVTVVGMRPGEQLRLERCGNARCSVAATVATWTFDTFEEYSPAEVPMEDDRYVFVLVDGNQGVVGTQVTGERGVTTLRFSSGTFVTATIRSRDPAGNRFRTRTGPRR
jgi:hypothetical protein